ncbi:hypothetical protein MPSEU_000923600 [Mayamaea pseudoterrestris]|nr:hypothetical protein MPSEU_000923600 [Mayamaea pseudoterrestris]
MVEIEDDKSWSSYDEPVVISSDAEDVDMMDAAGDASSSMEEGLLGVQVSSANNGAISSLEDTKISDDLAVGVKFAGTVKLGDATDGGANLVGEVLLPGALAAGKESGLPVATSGDHTDSGGAIDDENPLNRKETITVNTAIKNLRLYMESAMELRQTVNMQMGRAIVVLQLRARLMARKLLWKDTGMRLW